MVLSLIQSLPLQHRHHCKVDTWICPFSFHVKEVSLHLFVCLFVFFVQGKESSSRLGWASPILQLGNHTDYEESY